MNLSNVKKKILNSILGDIEKVCKETCKSRITVCQNTLAAIDSLIELLDDARSGKPLADSEDFAIRFNKFMDGSPIVWFDKRGTSSRRRNGMILDPIGSMEKRASPVLPRWIREYAQQVLPPEPLKLSEHAKMHCRVNLQYFFAATPSLRAVALASTSSLLASPNREAETPSRTEQLWDYAHRAKLYYEEQIVTHQSFLD